MRRAQKEQLVADLEEALGASDSVILTDYRGLSVKEMTQLRRAVSGAGGRLRVVKNSLFRRALGDGALSGLAGLLAGPVAAAFVVGDAVRVLKEISTFGQTHEQLGFRGGWVEKRLLSGEELEQLATLPPREELLAGLMASLSAPLYQLVGVLQAVPRDLALTLRALADTREEAGAGAGG